MHPQQFDPSLLYSLEGFTRRELELMGHTRSFFLQKYPKSSEIIQRTTYVLHASANFQTAAYIFDTDSLVCVDVELLRLVDLLTDCVEYRITKSLFGALSVDLLIRKIVFHGGARCGMLFGLDALPPLDSHRVLSDSPGAAAHFAAALLFVLCHETAHINQVLDTSTPAFIREHFASHDARQNFLGLGLIATPDPLSLIRALKRDHLIEPYANAFADLQDYSDTALSELYADFFGIALCVGTYRDAGLTLSSVANGIIGLQAAQMIIDISGLLLHKSGGIDYTTANAIVRCTERYIATCGMFAALLQRKFHHSELPKALHLLSTICSECFGLAVSSLQSVQAQAGALSSARVTRPSDIRLVAERWGYRSNRTGKLMFGGPVSSFLATRDVSTPPMGSE